MKKIVTMLLVILVVLSGILIGFSKIPTLDDVQKSTLLTICLIAVGSALYCFIVGEITGNTSQMDKLWSILPIVYTWIATIKSGFATRPLVFSIIVTLWGIRLTYNFARKGAYSIRFWEGEEDYRWAILRQTKPLDSKLVWCLFNLFFISLYQNFIVVAITFPIIAIMSSTQSFGSLDIIVTIIALLFLILEFVADEYQWHYHETKRNYC